MQMFVFAHISDTHIGQDRGDGGARARERTERVLRALDGLPGELDAVILTGDVTDHGTPGEYAEAVKLLDGSRHAPLHCPGNHDVRGPYRAALLGGDPADASPVNQIHTLPGATFAMCDSTVPGRGHGLLDDATLAWLDDALARSPGDRPAFVCCHHRRCRCTASTSTPSGSSGRTAWPPCSRATGMWRLCCAATATPRR
jgi:3',5'-cyclic AMP phosphodiesterase CpdA